MKMIKKYRVGALFLFLSAVLLSGCSNQPAEVKEGYFTHPSGDIAEINIDVKDRVIEILPSPDGDIHVSYFESEKEFYQIGVGEDKVLSVQSDSDKNFTDYFGLSGDSMGAIKLEVPNLLPCNLVISTTKNDIKLPEITVEGNVRIENNDGSIQLENSSLQGDIILNTKNGDITGTLAGSYEEYRIQSKAHKGESNLPESKTDGGKTLNVNTNNGDIEIAFRGSKQSAE